MSRDQKLVERLIVSVLAFLATFGLIRLADEAFLVDTRYEAYSLIVVESAPTFSVVRTQRSLSGLVGSESAGRPVGELVPNTRLQPIDQTPLARLVAVGPTPESASSRATAAGRLTVERLSTLEGAGLDARVFSDSSPATVRDRRASVAAGVVVSVVVASAVAVLQLLLAAMRSVEVPLATPDDR